MSRAQEMQELFGRWKESGLSLMAFGKREEVPYAQLLYWRRKLGGEATRRKPTARDTARPELLPVQVVADAAQADVPPDKFEVWLSNGVCLDVAPGFDEAELRRLVGVLLSC